MVALALGVGLTLIGSGEGTEAAVTEEGLASITDYLAQFGAEENGAMLLLDSGMSATGADANFYLHELYESQMVKELTAQGIDFDTAQQVAHQAALEYHNVSPYSLYAPEVIEAFPKVFNNNWRAYWGLPITQ